MKIKPYQIIKNNNKKNQKNIIGSTKILFIFRNYNFDNTNNKCKTINKIKIRLFSIYFQQNKLN